MAHLFGRARPTLPTRNGRLEVGCAGEERRWICSRSYAARPRPTIGPVSACRWFARARPQVVLYPAVHASWPAGGAMTGAEGEGSSHSDRPRRAAPSRSSDALAPVSEDGNARSADIATLAGVASSQPLGQSLRVLAAARSLPPQWVLNYQRTLGNQVTQRLLGERVARTPG